MKRITHEPAYVLHSYDWSESSLILEVLTRHHGRTALVAKGAKRPSSGFRPVLLPLQPLHLSYAGDAEIRTLKSAEWMGGHVMPSGDALLAGYYINELMIRLLARDDPHPALFDAYAATVAWLATHAGQGENLQAVLRAFELVLLREAGLLPALDVQTLSYQPLQADAAYALTPESGLLAVALASEPAHAPPARTLSGQHWLALQAAMDDAAPLRALLSMCLAQREVVLALKPQLRELLYYHCGVARLRTRQLLVDLHNL
ncbi:MAG: DNA repair protein RecO [Brachymonas sp.]|nr:DNA repair protein RecO [Brachymonas sp.]